MNAESRTSESPLTYDSWSPEFPDVYGLIMRACGNARPVPGSWDGLLSSNSKWAFIFLKIRYFVNSIVNIIWYYENPSILFYLTFFWGWSCWWRIRDHAAPPGFHYICTLCFRLVSYTMSLFLPAEMSRGLLKPLLKCSTTLIKFLIRDRHLKWSTESLFGLFPAYQVMKKPLTQNISLMFSLILKMENKTFQK